ncbi:hypothetical protein PUR59_01360 [Streptomyces sp. SP18ES09]|uniref:hypothetical protein n=1 Tax=Streptomyces sp. SP18ES09 TaxID=3002532 RepID=UPI002E796274|nr:hypothetical protein [Streptomyces sp. SP18ES09]MEE1813688.1 hypothetical protein [Streptomyces sp. SP18ES09]
MHRHATTALTASLLLALAACSSDADPKPPAASTSAARAYTYQDCVKLLDYDLTQGTPKDASKDPECAHLSPTEYQRAVGEVLTNHKDEILNPTQTP